MCLFKQFTSLFVLIISTIPHYTQPSLRHTDNICVCVCLQESAFKKAVCVSPRRVSMYPQEGCQSVSKKAVSFSFLFSIPLLNKIHSIFIPAVSVPPRKSLQEGCQCTSKTAVSISILFLLEFFFNLGGRGVKIFRF